MKIKELLEKLKGVEKSKLNKDELLITLKRLTNSANLRIRRLKKQNLRGDIFTPKSYFRYGGKKLTYNQLQARLTSVLKFLNRKTSTSRGLKDYLKKQDKYTHDMTDEEATNFWNAYNRFMVKGGMKEIYPSESGYNPVLEWLRGRFDAYPEYSYDEDNIYNALKRQFDPRRPYNESFGKYRFRKPKKGN